MSTSVTSNYFQERSGVLRVAAILNEKRVVFRETPNADVGLDGLLELVDGESTATGATVAVQIKSGTSYLNGAGPVWNYYPARKHAEYWASYPLPVLLILHDPTDDSVYWSDVRQQLWAEGVEKSPLTVPKASRLNESSSSEIFFNTGRSDSPFLDTVEALRTLANTKNNNASFDLSFLDLFTNGLTHLGNKLFFSVGMAWDLAELKLAEDAVTGVGMGASERDFLDSYLRFLVEQSLARIDYSEIVLDIESRSLYPTLLASLTHRGVAVRDLCRELGSTGNSRELTEAIVEIPRIAPMIDRSLANFTVSKLVADRLSSTET